jgi:hypothetical protein
MLAELEPPLPELNPKSISTSSLNTVPASAQPPDCVGPYRWLALSMIRPATGFAPSPFVPVKLRRAAIFCGSVQIARTVHDQAGYWASTERRSWKDYFTVSVSASVWPNFCDVPVTVRLYVPTGVPPLPCVLLLLPQATSTIVRHTRLAIGIQTRLPPRRVPILMAANSRQANRNA